VEKIIFLPLRPILWSGVLFVKWRLICEVASFFKWRIFWSGVFCEVASFLWRGVLFCEVASFLWSGAFFVKWRLFGEVASFCEVVSFWWSGVFPLLRNSTSVQLRVLQANVSDQIQIWRIQWVSRLHERYWILNVHGNSSKLSVLYNWYWKLSCSS
jgi:hypothetical protein